MLNLLQKLCAANAPSGFEGGVRDIIIGEIGEHCEWRVDRSGNLIAFKRGKRAPKNRVMFAAHMDEVGFMISYIEQDGTLRFSTLGGIDDKALVGRRVEVGDGRISGVIGSKPIHLIDRADREKAMPADKMYIDIGCGSREEAQKLTHLGDYAAFESGYMAFGADDMLVKAKAIDDRVGCAVLCELLKGELEYDLYAAFTVCEEIGMRGAFSAAYAVKPDIAVVFEGTTAADLADVPSHKQVCRLGEGVALSFMDKATLYDPALLELARAEASKRGIKTQYKAYVSGGNDAGAIQRSAGGARMMAVNVPVRYLHTASCVAHRADCEAMEKIAGMLAGMLGGV